MASHLAVEKCEEVSPKCFVLPVFPSRGFVPTMNRTATALLLFDCNSSETFCYFSTFFEAVVETSSAAEKLDQ